LYVEEENKKMSVKKKKSSGGKSALYLIGIVGTLICIGFLIWMGWTMAQDYIAWQEMVGTAGEGEYTFSLLNYLPYLLIIIVGLIVSISIMQRGNQ